MIFIKTKHIRNYFQSKMLIYKSDATELRNPRLSRREANLLNYLPFKKLIQLKNWNRNPVTVKTAARRSNFLRSILCPPTANHVKATLISKKVNKSEVIEKFQKSHCDLQELDHRTKTTPIFHCSNKRHKLIYQASKIQKKIPEIELRQSSKRSLR